MAKVVVRKETGKLVIDFTYRGVRCREQTALTDTSANRRRAGPILARLQAAVADGSFRYAEFFPGSALAARFDQTQKTALPVSQPNVQIGGAGTVVADEAQTPSFADFVTDWMRNHEVEWRRSHIKVLKSTVDSHLLPYFGSKPVAQITKADVLAFRTHLGKLPGRGGASLSNKRINGILGPLKQVLAEAAELHGFASPVTTLKPLKVRKIDIEPFTLDEVQRILATVRADFRDYFIVRFFTGMRTGEIHGLKWQYVDFANRLILVRETFVLGEDEYTKTDGSQREIRMNQVVFDALERQHAATREVSEYVFCNREGKPLDNDNFTDRVWYPLLRHLGFKLRRPYQTRHTAATLWLASGEAPEWISRQLGHSSTEMLFRVYSRFVPNLTRQDGSAIERLLASRFASGRTQQPGAARPIRSANDGEGANSEGRCPPAHPPPMKWPQLASMR